MPEVTPVLEKLLRVSGVPEKLLPLFALSHDLRWTWRKEIRALFEALDPEAWRRARGNPVRLFREVSAERLWHAAEDPIYQGALHEVIRRHSLAVADAVSRGQSNDLLARLAADPAFRGVSTATLQAELDPINYTGRAAQQVPEFIDEYLQPLLGRAQPLAAEAEATEVVV